MSDESNVVEVIELQLQTDFEQQLRANLTFVTNFATKTGDIFRSVAKSYNDMGKSVSENIQNMFGKSSKEITSALQQSRTLMRDVMAAGIDANKHYIATFEKLKQVQKEFQSELARTQNALKAAQKLEQKGDAKGGASPLLKMQIEKLKEREAGLTSQYTQDVLGAIDSASSKLGQFTQKATESYVNNAEKRLESVKNTINDVTNKLKIVESRFGMQDDLSKIYKFQDSFKDMQSQHANLQKQLQDQSKVTHETEKRLKEAEFAMNNSFSEKTKAQNKEVYEAVLNNQAKIKTSYDALEKEVNDFGNAVDSNKAKLNLMAQEFKKSIGAGVKSTDINRQMKAAMDSLVNEAKAAGSGMKDAFAEGMNKSKDIDTKLVQTIQKLQEMKKNAEALQKTGLVDVRSEITKIDSILNKYRAFWGEYKQQQKIIRDILGNQKGLELKSGLFDFNRIRKSVVEVSNEINKFGQISSQNFLEANEKVKQLKGLWDAYLVKRRFVKEQTIKIQSEMHKVEWAMAKTTNAQLLSELNAYHTKLASVWKQDIGTGAGLNRTTGLIEKEAKRVQDSIKNTYLKNTDYVNQGFNDIKKGYDSLFTKAEILSKKRFVSQVSINEAKAGFEQIKIKAQEYEKKILDLQNALKKLEAIQKRGLGSPGIQAQSEQLKNNIAQMRSYTQQLNQYSTQAQRNIERMQTKSLKNVLGNSWEMIRNFRWQVAAVIYLVTQAVNAVKRTFFSIINEAMEFRKNAMSIAASVSYQMVGDMEKNYKKAYNFSKQLMVQLELEAARTILTMEDMLMLTKTLAQAGIIPDTREDVKKISTIGTAIKALTEGMANAGVQMRQELYAVLTGRQRAVDQLSMMFKMVGIDIKQLFIDGEKAGEKWIDTLSNALKPFEEMNKILEKEYQTVVNQLDVIWGIIKRIAAEPVMDMLAESIQKINDLLFDAKEEILTAYGEDVVKALRSVLVLMYEFGKSSLEIFKSLSGIIASVFNIFVGGRETVKNVNGELVTVDANMGAIINTSEVLAKALVQIELVLYDIATVVRIVANGFSIIYNGVWDIQKLLAYGIRGLVTGSFGDLKEEFGSIMERYEDFNKSLNDFGNIPDNRLKRLDDVNNAFKSITNSANNLNTEWDKLKQFRLPHDIMDLAGQGAKLDKQLDELKKASLEGPEKFQFEYELTVAENEETVTKLKENIAALSGMLKEHGHELDESQLKYRQSLIKNWTDVVGKIEQINNAAAKKRDKQIADYGQKAGQSFSDMKQQAEQFWESLSERPESRSEKTDKWFRKMEIDLIHHAETNSLVAKNIQSYWDKLYDSLTYRREQDARLLAEEIEQLENRIQSHNVINVFEAIDTEMNKIKMSIEQSVDLMDEANQDRQKALLGMVEVARKERKELELQQQMYENQLKYLDIISDRANLMKDSYSPLTQQKGEILELQSNYMKAGVELKKQLDIIKRENQDSFGFWKDNTKEAQKYFALLQEQYKVTGIAFKRDMWEVQNPLWNDLIEMSKSWADQISDSLVDLVMDFENFGESIQQVWESIVRDALRLVIQRKLMEPLMDMWSSNQPEEKGTSLTKMLGGGAVDTATGMMNQMQKSANGGSVFDQLLSVGQPIPVYLVDTPIFGTIADNMKSTTEAVINSGNETKGVLSNGFSSLGNALSSMLSGIFGSMGNGANSLGMQGLGALLGGLSSYYGGGGMNTGAPAHIAAGGTTAFGMANGGTISEHIVGKGLSSGKVYEFGERSKYGEFEDIVPRNKSSISGSSQSVTLSMPINISAIDTQSGVQFIMDNQKLIEANMLRSFKNNKSIRAMVTRAK